MANDSPAKSLGDIDLASLRVSAAEPSPSVLPPSFLFLLFFFSPFKLAFNGRRSTETHVPTASLALASFFVRFSCVRSLAELPVLKMTAEPRRGVATVCLFLCSRCVWHGAQQLARTGHRCSQEKKNKNKKHNTPKIDPFFVCLH